MKKTLIALVVMTSCSVFAESMTPTPSPSDQSEQVTDTTSESFFDDSERGWYWYEQLPQEEKDKLKELFTKAPPQQEQSQPSKEKIKPLSVEWFQQNFDKYKHAAMDNPHDTEAMRNYLYLEKYMIDKAVTFGYERQKIVLAEPFLDASSSRPVANFGMKSMSQEASKMRERILEALGENTGIYFFYRSDDVFSEQQAPLIKLLEKKYGFSVMPVSLDGTAPSEEQWDSFLEDNGEAEAWGVKQVPATFLFNPNNNTVELISQGLQSLPDMKTRIIYAAERNGIISPEQAEKIRASGLYKNVNGDVAGDFPFPENAPETFKKLYLESVSQ